MFQRFKVESFGFGGVLRYIPCNILLDISQHSSRENLTGNQPGRRSECRIFSGFSPVFAGLFRLALENYRRLTEIVVDIAAETQHISFVTGYQADAYRLWFG